MLNDRRTFGVEIEFVGDGGDVKRAMIAQGLECEVEGYNHTTKRHWKIVTDGSVYATGNQRGYGLELVSPILKGQEGMAQLEKACKALANAGAKVNKTCGLHVHHDARDFQAQTFVNLLNIYAGYEGTMDSLVALSRRADNNTYCGSVRTILVSPTRQQRIAEEVRHDNARAIIGVIGTRYVKLNFQSYVTHGTVEFRQHQGTIEFEKMKYWVMLTQAMVERSLRKVNKIRVDSWENFKYFLAVNPENENRITDCDEDTKAMFKYFNKRRKELAA